MRICPNCGKVVSYNSYFGAYICSNCKWEDATNGNKRNIGKNNYTLKYFVKITKKTVPPSLKKVSPSK